MALPAGRVQCMICRQHLSIGTLCTLLAPCSVVRHCRRLSLLLFVVVVLANLLLSETSAAGDSRPCCCRGFCRGFCSIWRASGHLWPQIELAEFRLLDAKSQFQSQQTTVNCWVLHFIESNVESHVELQHVERRY